jgi:RNA-splicing ligase RtcB
VDQVFGAVAARLLGLEEGMICVMIHSGSRGLGYQVCDDALRSLRGASSKYDIALPDRQRPAPRRTVGRVGATLARCALPSILPGATDNC